MFKKNLEKVALPYLPCVNTFSKKAITQPKKFCFENPFGGDDDEGSCMILFKNNIQFKKKSNKVGLQEYRPLLTSSLKRFTCSKYVVFLSHVTSKHFFTKT